MPDIYLAYGSDCIDLTTQLLESADVKSRVPQNAKVIIKPNLVTPTRPEHGATTHAGIAEAVILYLQKYCSPASITVAEGAWIGAKTTQAFTICGYDDLAKKYGVALLDTKKDETVSVTAHGIELEVCKTFLEADYFINLPVLKGHSQTKMTCCLKNLKGCIPDSEKSRYHKTGLHKPIAALTTVLKPDLHIVDSICGDPTFEEGGSPLQTDRMLLGFDPVLLDSYCSGLIGVDYRAVRYLCLAQEWGVGKFAPDKPDILEIGGENRPDIPVIRSDVLSYLAEFVEEDSACSACYAALLSALNKMAGEMPVYGEIKVGQGFRGKEMDGVGVGDCTAGCSKHQPGCPPKAGDILTFLRSV